MAGLTPRYPGCPAGPAMQHPGDALRPEFRTQNGSGPHLLQGEHDKSGLFWGPCSRLGHRGPLPQSPLACVFLCKMRLRCLSVRTTVFSFSAHFAMWPHILFPNLAIVVRFTAVDAAVPTGLPRLSTHSCWGPKKLPPLLRAV